MRSPEQGKHAYEKERMDRLYHSVAPCDVVRNGAGTGAGGYTTITGIKFGAGNAWDAGDGFTVIEGYRSGAGDSFTVIERITAGDGV